MSARASKTDAVLHTTRRRQTQVRGSLWRALVVMALGCLLLGLSLRPAAALEPVSAQLSIVYGAPDGIAYVGVQLPNGETTAFSSGGTGVSLGLVLQLVVTFDNGSTADVTFDPNTQFTSVPSRPPFQGSFPLSGSDAGSQFELTGTYTDPATGNQVSDSLTVKVENFVAPSFYDAGKDQSRWLQDVKQLSQQTEAWLRADRVPAQSAAQVRASLEQLRIFFSIWWTWKIVAPIGNLGNSLQALGAPSRLLERLSTLVADLNSAGLLGLDFLGELATLDPRLPTMPPWLPSFAVVGFFSGPISISWFGLAR